MNVDPNTGIWDLDIAKRRHKFDLQLTTQIAKIYSPIKAADIGCGNGTYCKALKAFSWPIVHGYEGTPNIKELNIYDDIMVIDLTKRRWVEMNYDFVLCLEVGEHIPKQFEQIFVDNLCEYTHKDLVLSWAVPGQGGTGHFNEQPNIYVALEIRKRGFKLEKEKTLMLRRAASLRWLRQTLMVFSRS